MKRNALQISLWLALPLLVVLAAPAKTQRGLGQGRRGQGRGPMEAPPGGRGGAKLPGGSKNEQATRRLLDVPPKWMERLREMSPENQERFLTNNEHFQKLPPERQAQVRNNLQRWNSLTPEQREAVRQRERVWEQMSPEQRRLIQEDILPKWQQLPQGRRQVLLQHLRELRGLGDSEREARLNDPSFMQSLNPDEQSLLRQLSNLKVGPPPEAP